MLQPPAAAPRGARKGAGFLPWAIRPGRGLPSQNPPETARFESRAAALAGMPPRAGFRRRAALRLRARLQPVARRPRTHWMPPASRTPPTPTDRRKDDSTFSSITSGRTKTRPHGRGIRVGHLHGGHLRGGRAGPQPFHEATDGRLIPTGEHLDTTVGQVAGMTANPELPGTGRRGCPIKNPLYPAADQTLLSHHARGLRAHRERRDSTRVERGPRPGHRCRTRAFVAT